LRQKRLWDDGGGSGGRHDEIRVLVRNFNLITYSSGQMWPRKTTTDYDPIKITKQP